MILTTKIWFFFFFFYSLSSCLSLLFIRDRLVFGLLLLLCNCLHCAACAGLSLSLSMLYFCSADGHYELKLNTKAIVHHNGLVAWQPPATYKSACDIDVEYFPLDIQTCFLKLGTWTYAGYQVRITNIKKNPPPPKNNKPQPIHTLSSIRYIPLPLLLNPSQKGVSLTRHTFGFYFQSVFLFCFFIGFFCVVFWLLLLLLLSRKNRSFGVRIKCADLCIFPSILSGN
jgi:hypothetical protein